MKNLALLLCVLAGAALSILRDHLVEAQAQTTYYVSTFGKDTTCLNARNPGTPAGPKLKFVLGCMAGSDPLVIREGVYDEPLHKTGFNGFFPSGTAAAPTVFRAWPGEKVWIRGIVNGPWGAIFEFDGGASYIVFDGINFDGFVEPAARGFAHEYVPIKLGASSHHIKITNFEAKNLPDGWFSSNSGNDNEIGNFKMYDSFPASSYNSGGTACGQPTCWGYPFYWNGRRNKVLNGEVYNVPSWVVHLYCSGAAYCNNPTETLVQNLNIHDFGFGDPRANGILVSQGNLNAVLNNAIWNSKSPAAPIAIGAAATNPIVNGNTFVAPGIPPPEPAPDPKPGKVFIDVKTDQGQTVTVTVDGIKR